MIDKSIGYSTEELENQLRKAGRVESEVKLETQIICPICKTDKLDDISPQQNNGIYGSGFASWKIIELRKCPNCKIVIAL